MEELKKKYEIENSATVINLENMYVHLVEKEEEKVKKAFENELMILTLKLKKLKTMGT